MLVASQKAHSSFLASLLFQSLNPFVNLLERPALESRRVQERAEIESVVVWAVGLGCEMSVRAFTKSQSSIGCLTVVCWSSNSLLMAAYSIDSSQQMWHLYDPWAHCLSGAAPDGAALSKIGMVSGKSEVTVSETK